MVDFAISPASQASLWQLQRTSSQRAEITRRLSEGLRVGRAADGPAAYFQSKGLTNRVNDLLRVKDNIGQAISSVSTALAGVDAIDKLTKQLKGIALSVRGATSAPDRQAAAAQFDELRRQITNIANDTSYSGVSLIGGPPGDLEVTLNETNSAIVTVEGSPADASGLSISDAAAFNNFAADADIDNAVANLDTAISTLRAQASGLGSDVALLKTRQDFTAHLTNTLTEGAAKLVEADLNEEAAKLLATQVRSALSLQGLKILASGERLVAQLLG